MLRWSRNKSRLVQGSRLWLVATISRKSESSLEVDQAVQEAPPCPTSNTDFI